MEGLGDSTSSGEFWGPGWGPIDFDLQWLQNCTSAPPQSEFPFDQSAGFDPTDPEPVPDFEFDQSLPD